MHKSDDLIGIFNRLFAITEKTQLVKGLSEPLYRPASDTEPYNQIIFANGFFASALHEVAHWCIAGKKRRALLDYGYWYEPDGRSPEKQEAFAKVEARPQAIEWIFHQSAGHRFVVSIDNLSLNTEDFLPFKQAVIKEVKRLQHEGLPARAEQFQKALASFYNQPSCYTQYNFCHSVI